MKLLLLSICVLFIGFVYSFPHHEHNHNLDHKHDQNSSMEHSSMDHVHHHNHSTSDHDHHHNLSDHEHHHNLTDHKNLEHVHVHNHTHLAGTEHNETMTDHMNHMTMCHEEPKLIDCSDTMKSRWIFKHANDTHHECALIENNKCSSSRNGFESEKMCEKWCHHDDHKMSSEIISTN